MMNSSFFSAEIIIIIIIIITKAFVRRHKVRRYRAAGGIRLRLSEQMGLEVSFEGVHNPIPSSSPPSSYAPSTVVI